MAGGILAPIITALVTYRRLRQGEYERPPVNLSAGQGTATIQSGKVEESYAEMAPRRLAEVGLTPSGPGTTLLNLTTTLSAVTDLVPRVRFATSAQAIRDLTRLNCAGYDGSQYGSASDPEQQRQKLARNQQLAARNPYVFASVADQRCSGLDIGFTSVVPLTTDGARRYLGSGEVRDNDLTGHMVAKPGQPFDTVILFAIATIKLRRGREGALPQGEQLAAARRPDVAAVLDLMRAVVLQLAVLSALAKMRDEVLLVGQSRVPNIQELFESIGMLPDPTRSTKDGEPFYSARLEVLGAGQVEDALRSILEQTAALTRTDRAPWRGPRVLRAIQGSRQIHSFP